MGVSLVGTGAAVCVGVLVRTGPLTPRFGRALHRCVLGRMRSHVDAIVNAASVPEGIVVTFTYADAEGAVADIAALTNLADQIEMAAQSASETSVDVDTALLLNSLMCPEDQYPQRSSQGLEFTLHLETAFSADCDGRMQARISEHLQPAFAELVRSPGGPATDNSYEPSRRWITLANSRVTNLRYYRPLPPASTRDRALARSLANAVIGGMPNSQLDSVLRTSKQLCYQPYSVMTALNGRQWVLIDVDTTPDREAELLSEMVAFLPGTALPALTPIAVERAANFMCKMRERAEKSLPDLINLRFLPYSGLDPESISDTHLDELLSVPIEVVRDEAAGIYTLTQMSVIGISPTAEPTWP